MNINRRLTLHRVLWRLPCLYQTIALLREWLSKDTSRYRKSVVTKDSSFVLEGYPRCANTFITTKLIAETESSIKPAHHYHSPVQYIIGAKLNKKVFLIIRDPIDAICSMCEREPALSPQIAAKLYLDFYSPVIKQKLNFHVFTFDAIVRNPGSCIDYILKQVNYSLSRKSLGDDEVFKIIEKRSKKNNGDRLLEHRVPRPSEARRKNKEKLKVRINKLVEPALIQACEQLYTQILGDAQKIGEQE